MCPTLCNARARAHTHTHTHTARVCTQQLVPCQLDQQRMLHICRQSYFREHDVSKATNVGRAPGCHPSRLSSVACGLASPQSCPMHLFPWQKPTPTGLATQPSFPSCSKVAVTPTTHCPPPQQHRHSPAPPPPTAAFARQHWTRGVCCTTPNQHSWSNASPRTLKDTARHGLCHATAQHCSALPCPKVHRPPRPSTPRLAWLCSVGPD